jgi:DNA-binding MarR family transcriptional regulator
VTDALARGNKLLAPYKYLCDTVGVQPTEAHKRVWRAACPEDELLVAVINLKRALHQIGDTADGAVEPGVFQVLHHLASVGASRPGQIASALGLDASTVSRHVRTLTRRGLIASVRDRTDGRASVLTLTDAGIAFLSRNVRLRREAMARGTAGFTPNERDELIRLLQKFTEAISPAGDQNRQTLESL